MRPRTPLRADVHVEIRERIIRASYPPGTRVRDTHLAEELEVSRTPVREALLRLAAEGFVDASPGRGFTVRALTRSEVLEVYPLIWSLESTGLRTGGPHGPAQLDELDAIASALEAARGDPEARIALDDQWHRTLLAGCNNDRLLRMVDDLKQVARRYELSYMVEESWVATSADDHRRIAAVLAKSGPGAAADVLERHWKFGMEAVLAKLPGEDA